MAGDEADVGGERVDRTLAEWLVESEIPSFSPRTGTVLMRIAEAVTEKITELPEGELRDQATGYVAALVRVYHVPLAYQGLVIDEFKKLLEKSRGGEIMIRGSSVLRWKSINISRLRSLRDQDLRVLPSERMGFEV